MKLTMTDNILHQLKISITSFVLVLICPSCEKMFIKNCLAATIMAIIPFGDLKMQAHMFKQSALCCEICR